MVRHAEEREAEGDEREEAGGKGDNNQSSIQNSSARHKPTKFKLGTDDKIRAIEAKLQQMDKEEQQKKSGVISSEKASEKPAMKSFGKAPKTTSFRDRKWKHPYW